MQIEELRARLRGQIAPEQWQWLESACALQGDRLLAAFVGAARRLGNERLGGPDPLGSWQRSCAARVAMVLSLDAQDPQACLAWTHRAYREGDSGEKLAIIRALPLLRDAQHYVELALDCGRTNETELFAALAIDNAFPARQYTEPAFNSLVIKAAQLDLPLERVHGILDRQNSELARIGMEYIDERQSASRSYPPSLWLAIAGVGPPGALARMLGELHHSVAARRLGAVWGLALCSDPRAIDFLKERLDIETSPEIEAAITEALKGKTS